MFSYIVLGSKNGVVRVEIHQTYYLANCEFSI